MVERVGPSSPSGLSGVHVGCGPHNLLPEWWNVDIREFDGVDQVLDVTKPWAWHDQLDYIYGEHFLEHLELRGSIDFLKNSYQSLRRGGRIRLSTPSLEWVLSTHFDLSCDDAGELISQTFRTNRAFHGWGHKLLYSRSILTYLLESIGFQNVVYYAYGVSDDLNLCNLENHGGYYERRGYPSVWIVEAEKIDKDQGSVKSLLEYCHEEYIRYVDSGH